MPSSSTNLDNTPKPSTQHVWQYRDLPSCSSLCRSTLAAHNFPQKPITSLPLPHTATDISPSCKSFPLLMSLVPHLSEAFPPKYVMEEPLKLRGWGQHIYCFCRAKGKLRLLKFSFHRWSEGGKIRSKRNAFTKCLSWPPTACTQCVYSGQQTISYESCSAVCLSCIF